MNTIFKKIGSWFKNEPEPPRLHRKWTVWDELRDTYSQWLPFLTIILVVTVIIVALALVSATESNMYYYHLGGV